MKVVRIFKLFIIFLILFKNLQICYSAPNKNQARLLADNNTALIEDVKWFFRGTSRIAGTVEQMLPNVTTNEMRTRSFSENTKLTFLMGLRHLLVGVREISMTFEQSFNTDHIKQLQQLKNATNFVNDLLNDLKMWFSQIRALVMHLVHLYNRYIPEVLFGKCVGIYLISNYPERSFYEYPFILLTEIYSSIVTAISDATITKTSSDPSILDTDLNVEQNEIPHSDSDDYRNSYGRSSSSSSSSSSLSSSQLDKATSQAESFFDFSSVVSENKDKLIDSAVNQHSWQTCLKLYTAESISRSLKTYFLGL